MTTLNYNVAANHAANALTKNERLMNESMTRLSTGKRLNSGADDPGSFGVYSNLVAAGVTARTAVANVNQAVSYMQTVDSGAASIQSLVLRMKEIATQAASALTSAQDRYALDSEYNKLGNEWIRIAADTMWNGTQALIGTDVSIRTGSTTTMTFAMDDWRNTANAANGVGIATAATAAGSANSGGGATGAFTSFTQGDIAATGAVPARSNAHIATDTAASAASAQLTNALVGVASSRAEIGGWINGLQTAGESLANVAVAYESAGSRVGDANYAKETTALAASQIVSQAATAILAQANAQKATVLGLLK